jgi:hypothetical protein
MTSVFAWHEQSGHFLSQAVGFSATGTGRNDFEVQDERGKSERIKEKRMKEERIKEEIPIAPIAIGGRKRKD